MKKHTESQPIDDLFARKLSNMSLPPSQDGFERLQARMGNGKPATKLVFWRNPTVQRYMAAAACLVVVGSFGWLYLPSDSQELSTKDDNKVSLRQSTTSNDRNRIRSDHKDSQSDSKNKDSAVSNQQETQIALVEKEGDLNSSVQLRRKRVADEPAEQQERLASDQKNNLAQAKASESSDKSETLKPIENIGANQTEATLVADNKPVLKPAAPVEKVLIVTIDEPATLAAARQTAKALVEEKTVVAIDGKPEQESKTGGLWQQVKRLKHGEIFAKRDNVNNEDRGLLDRAYSGIKQSFDKEKSSKQ